MQCIGHSFSECRGGFFGGLRQKLVERKNGRCEEWHDWAVCEWKCFKVTGAKPIVSFCFFTKSCLFSLKHGLQGSRFLLSGMFNIFVLVEMWSLPRGKKALHELLKLILMWDLFFIFFY